MLVAPRDGRANGLCRIALAVELRREDPTDLRHPMERRLDIPLVVCESNLSDKAAGGLLCNHPIAEAEQCPMADVTQQPAPGFLAGERSAADMARDDGVCPHGATGGEICKTMPAQLKPFCFEDRYLGSGMERTRHTFSVSPKKRILQYALSGLHIILGHRRTGLRSNDHGFFSSFALRPAPGRPTAASALERSERRASNADRRYAQVSDGFRRNGGCLEAG